MDSENRKYAFFACEHAYFALRQGRYADANALAREAARLASDWEVPWLIMAASSAPENSIEYLKTALEINASSPYARQGMRWAAHRLRTSQALTNLYNPYTLYQRPPTPLFDTTQKIHNERELISRQGGKLFGKRVPAIAPIVINLVILLLFMLASLSIGHFVYPGNSADRQPVPSEKNSLEPTSNPPYALDLPSAAFLLHPMPTTTILIPVTSEPQPPETAQLDEIAYLMESPEAESHPVSIESKPNRLYDYLSEVQVEMLNTGCNDCPLTDVTSSSTYIPEGCTLSTNIGYVMTAFQLINQLRTNLGLERLIWNDQLALSAYKHSIDMACNEFFSHINLDHVDYSDRVGAEGYVFTAVGETIYAGDGMFNSPARMYRAWFNSQAHFQVMIHPALSEVGIGYVYRPDSRYGGYFTADFGAP